TSGPAPRCTRKWWPRASPRRSRSTRVSGAPPLTATASPGWAARSGLKTYSRSSRRTARTPVLDDEQEVAPRIAVHRLGEDAAPRLGVELPQEAEQLGPGQDAIGAAAAPQGFQEPPGERGVTLPLRRFGALIDRGDVQARPVLQLPADELGRG